MTSTAPHNLPDITPISFTLWRDNPEKFARDLGQSFRETGFAIIDDHPIDEAVITDANTASQRYFALPQSVKAKYENAADGYQRGQSSFGIENAKGKTAADQKEFWHTGRATDGVTRYAGVMKPTPSVAEVDGFDAATRALFDALDNFGVELMRAVSLSLDLPRDWFDPHVDFGNSILRLLHYPPQISAPPPGSVRAGAHEDINLITLLLGAEEAGLQAKHRSGQWMDINPAPGSIVVNCGDMLQRFTAGKLPSTTHRVLNPSPERAKFPRYSMPFFMHLNPDCVISPIESCVEDDAQIEPDITAADYLRERLIEIGLIKV